MIGRFLLALFGMEQVFDRCPCCGAKKLQRTHVKAKWHDPVALYLDDQITVEELERRA